MDANFYPTKRFFVEMLTRDIELTDSILDLLDNCIDGIVRERGMNPDSYEGYFAKIEFDTSGFQISDNCGGIPKDKITYAFRLGRPESEGDENLNTVGMYGIGMKRAMFKLGDEISLESQSGNNFRFKFDINDHWLRNDEAWTIHIEEMDVIPGQNETIIIISDLHKSIIESITFPNFLASLNEQISKRYTYILQKGFKVFLNKKEITPKPLELKFEKFESGKQQIIPYIYKGKFENLDVDIRVGFFSNSLASEKEIEESLTSPRMSSSDAGWTIICNDRIIIYKDKTETTGWGAPGGVPRFHSQFRGISGIVQIKGPPKDMPLTTTKQGIVEDKVYWFILKKMIEGTKLFITFTNKWKGANLDEGNRLLSTTKKALAEKVDDYIKIPQSEWKKVYGTEHDVKFIPTLPTPASSDTTRIISFKKPLDEIETIAEFLFDDADVKPSEVGQKCFERVLNEATR